jgi:hypothetical protein
MTIKQEIDQALDQLAQAAQNFNNADPEFVDVAILEMQAAEAKVDLLYRLAKKSA